MEPDPTSSQRLEFNSLTEARSRFGSRIGCAAALLALALGACSGIDTETATFFEVAGVSVPVCPGGPTIVANPPLTSGSLSGASPRDAFNPFSEDHRMPSNVIGLDGADVGSAVFARASADGRYYEEVYVVRDGFVTEGYGCGEGTATFEP
jgi:hypothetical protein